MAGRRPDHPPTGASRRWRGVRTWSPDTWAYVMGIGVTAIMVALGVAMLIAGESPQHRQSGWVLVIGGLILCPIVILLALWLNGRAASGRFEFVPGVGVAAGVGWDRSRGRRFFLLWYLGSIVGAIGVATMFWTPAGVVGLWAGVLCWAVARRSLRLGMGLSRLESMLGRRGRHPIALAPTHEPGTWWARWAWVDLAIEIAAGAALLTRLQG